VEGRVIVDVGDVRDAERIATTLLDKYWSKSDRLWVYSFDIFWSRKDIQIQYDRYSLNYTYEFKRFVLNKIIYQIALNTELYFRGTKHPWDNRTWIQYDRINKRLFIYHNGYFTGDDPTGMGSINAIFYLDEYRFVIINLAPAEYCLPNYTTFKYNGTYIKLIEPCSPKDRERLRFWYIYFHPPYIIAFTEPYNDELAPAYVGNVVVITRSQGDRVFMDKIFENFVNNRFNEFKKVWISRFGDKGIDMSLTSDPRNSWDVYFDLRKVPNTPNNTRFFNEFEKNITHIYWREIIKPILQLTHIHANSLEDIMLALLLNKHEVIYLSSS